MVTDFQICSMRLKLRLRLHKNAKKLSFNFLDKTSRVGPSSPVPHLALRVELFIEFLKIIPLKA